MADGYSHLARAGYVAHTASPQADVNVHEHINSDPGVFCSRGKRCHSLIGIDGKNGSVSAFAIDRTNGDLRFLNAVSSQGAGPAHLSIDASGKYEFVANYFGDPPTTVLAPALLFDDVTVRRANEKNEKLPFYPPPD